MNANACSSGNSQRDRPGKPAGCQDTAPGDLHRSESNPAKGLVEPVGGRVSPPPPSARGAATCPRSALGSGERALCKDDRKGAFVAPELPPPAGTANSAARSWGKQRTKSGGSGMIDNTDPKPRRGRDKIREPGTEGFKRQDVAGN